MDSRSDARTAEASQPSLSRPQMRGPNPASGVFARTQNERHADTREVISTPPRQDGTGSSRVIGSNQNGGSAGAIVSADSIDRDGRTTVTVQSAPATTACETPPRMRRLNEFVRAPITMWSTRLAPA